MEDILLRDRVEIERRRDEERKLDRINAIERAMAVLQTVFDAHREHAITVGDLEKLKKEVETEMQKTIGHVCDHFDSRTDQQSKDILSEVRGMFLAQKDAQAEDQKAFRRQIFFIVFSSAIGVVGTVIGALAVFGLLGRH